MSEAFTQENPCPESIEVNGQLVHCYLPHYERRGSEFASDFPQEFSHYGRLILNEKPTLSFGGEFVESFLEIGWKKKVKIKFTEERVIPF